MKNLFLLIRKSADFLNINFIVTSHLIHKLYGGAEHLLL